MEGKEILVTGSAGFIGFHVALRLLREGVQVAGLDNLNPYYDVSLKEARLGLLLKEPTFRFVHLDLADRQGMEKTFQEGQFEQVIHLAAQAGVRYSLTHPHVYAESNLIGFTNILEGCRHSRAEHLVFASSSSVYGANTKLPYSVQDKTDRPVSIYAATKKANEVMAYAYAHLYGLPCTGLRFFTVYGPWGRPDMAIFLFTRAILEGRSIDVYNYGNMRRDFTYIDDIVEGVVRTARKIPGRDGESGLAPGQAGQDRWGGAPYRLYNIGNHRPVEVGQLIDILERKLGRKAERNLLPIQPGDVPATFANIDDLAASVGFSPNTPLEVGVGRFVEWYRNYYQV